MCITSRRRKAGDRVLGCIRPVGWAKRLGSAWLDSAWLGTARLGSAQRGAARLGSAQSVRTLDRHFFLTQNVCEKNTSKNTLQGGTAVSGCQNGTVPEQGEIHLAYSLFANFIENDFKTKLRKIRLSEVPQFLAPKMGRSRSRAKST